MPRRRRTEPKATRSLAPNDRWRCTVCQGWKFTSEYTDRQLDIVRKDTALQPANCFMTCRDCAEQPELYQCEGRCGGQKPASKFSKQARRNQVWKCMECVSWDGLEEAYAAPLEHEHLATMEMTVDAATTLAGSFEDEPANHPEDSDWALSIARAAKAAGRPVPESVSSAVFSSASSTPAGIKFHVFNSRGQPLHKEPGDGESSQSTSSGF